MLRILTDRDTEYNGKIESNYQLSLAIEDIDMVRRLCRLLLFQSIIAKEKQIIGQIKAANELECQI